MAKAGRKRKTRVVRYPASGRITRQSRRLLKEEGEHEARYVALAGRAKHTGLKNRSGIRSLGRHTLWCFVSTRRTSHGSARCSDRLSGDSNASLRPERFTDPTRAFCGSSLDLSEWFRRWHRTRRRCRALCLGKVSHSNRCVDVGGEGKRHNKARSRSRGLQTHRPPVVLCYGPQHQIPPA